MDPTQTNLFWTENYGASYLSTPIDKGFAAWLVRTDRAYNWKNSRDKTQRGVLLNCKERLTDLYEMWLEAAYVEPI